MAAAALAIGAGLSAYGSITAGMEKNQAYQLEAANKRAQAAQVDIAARREEELTARRYDKVAAAQKVAFGRSGVQVGTGSPLEALELTAVEKMDEIRSIRDAARYRKSSLLTESLYSERLGQQAENAGYLGALQAGVGAFSKNPYSYDKRIG